MSNSVNPFNDLNNVDTNKIKQSTTNTTSRKPANKLDQDAFVRILTAEMANQSPDSNQDPTAFISQMAQFSSVEQMLNLNRTMTFNGASSLVGKAVTMNSVDSNGNIYRGTVEKVTRNGDNVQVYISLIDQDGKPIYQEQLDSNGKPVVKDGKIVYVTKQVQKTDSNGNPVTDPKTGKPVYEDVKVNKVMPFDYSEVASVIGDSDVKDTEKAAVSNASSTT
ncbi:flagellar hook assembly protein FlgD [Clostridium neuense]|uniref:Basal-body rod modification protein FlgD n=1 Tax=Clostridium neuense TaxID=1728934 RepID=A0ABW8TGG9_9CLOT